MKSLHRCSPLMLLAGAFALALFTAAPAFADAHEAGETIKSGTVSAAMEGLMAGVNSMAVSLTSFSSTQFQPAADFVRDWLANSQASAARRPPMLLNVNVPALAAEDICGAVLAPLGMRHYSETFEKRVDPRGKTYYWIAGEAIDTKAAPDSDIAAIHDNYITITPLHFDLTCHRDFDTVSQWGIPPYQPKLADIH